MSANHRTETLGDMLKHGGGNLAAECGCGRRGVLDGRKLVRYYFVRRWDTRRHMICDHLRCSICGARPMRIGGTYAAPTGPEWGPRDEGQWRRLTARLRS